MYQYAPNCVYLLYRLKALYRLTDAKLVHFKPFWDLNQLEHVHSVSMDIVSLIPRDLGHYNT